MAPPPMPTMGPPTWPSQTEKGVRNISYTIILFLIVAILTIVLVVALFPLLAAVIAAGQSGATDPGLLASLAGVLGAACGVLIAALVGLILGLIGLIALHRGGQEFGPEHSKRVDRGIIALVIGILVPTIASGILTAASATATTPIPGGFVPVFDPAVLVGTSAFGVLQALLVGLFLLWSVEAFISPQGRQTAMIALALGIASGIASGVVGALVLSTTPLPTRPEDVSFLFLVPTVAAQALSIGSLAAWYAVYSGVRDRFRRGELRAAPPAWTYYPPPYYPPQPAAPPPGTPPGSGPGVPPERPPGT